MWEVRPFHCVIPAMSPKSTDWRLLEKLKIPNILLMEKIRTQQRFSVRRLMF
jgi:hypothetical protein